jgi:hypothetical protein
MVLSIINLLALFLPVFLLYSQGTLIFIYKFIIRAVDRFISYISRTSSTINKNLSALEKLLRGSEISKVI